jgi:diguanylate cyclase (GGDEF)-like protein
MTVMPQLFYTGSLIAVLAVISISVLIASHSLGIKNNAPTALRLFQLYFIGGFSGWLFFGLIEFAHLSISLSWLAIAYFCAASLLLFILQEKIKVNIGSILWVLSHLVFIILELFAETIEAQLWIFTIYVLIHMSVLSLVALKCKKCGKNVGFNIITLAIILPLISSFVQIYILIYQYDINIVSGLGISGAATSYSLVALGFMTMMLVTERDSFQAQAHKDALTGLYNRRGLDIALEHLVAASKRNSSQISAIVCDIDFFKKINDTYGHDIGDIVLQQFSKILKDIPRTSDLSARLGGEEFILILPKTDQNGAIKLAERIRKQIEDLIISIPNGTVRLTASFGVSSHLQNINIDSLIKAADKALYEAKSSGRNKVCLADIEYSQSAFTKKASTATL